MISKEKMEELRQILHTMIQQDNADPCKILELSRQLDDCIIEYMKNDKKA